MEKKLYHFTYSQDVIRLQSKYALFKRVLNILFSLTFDEGFDEKLMRQAFEKLYERNDCLRLRFVKQGKETMQFFEPARKPGDIPSLHFRTNQEYETFFRRFRRKAIDLTKGETLRVVFAVNPEGKQMVICKISHYAADTYGIGVLAEDLMAIYHALRDGKELPPAPGSFEEIVRKDNEYREDSAATERDRAYLRDYFFKLHPNHPVYCGTHGNQNDRWLKCKQKGKFSIPMLMIRCDTYPMQYAVPAAVTVQAEKWCEEHAISLNSLFFMGFILTLSLINDRETRLLNVEILNCRGSLADRKTAGTKAQGMAVCTDIDYSKGFLANANALSEEQKELYRHTRLSYLEGEIMQHEAWKHSMLDMLNGCGFSYIPFYSHDGVQLSLHSNGKGALITYVALMHDLTHNEIFINYDMQKLMVTPKQLTDFQNRYLRVMETVLADSETPLGQLL
jgi:hypothetical protein